MTRATSSPPFLKASKNSHCVIVCPRLSPFFNPVANKHTFRDSGRGLDIAEQSLRNVFNDVSKYIRNISVSLNAVLPKLPDNHDRAHSLWTDFAPNAGAFRIFDTTRTKLTIGHS